MIKPLTHKILAAALKVSRPYVTKLVSLGMPTDTIPNAKRWYRQWKESVGCGKNAPKSINQLKAENIALKNELLRREIAELEDTSELIAVSRLTDALKHFLVWGRISGSSAAQLSAENLAAAGTPEEAHRIATALVNDCLFEGLIAMLTHSKLRDDDPRVFTLVSQAVKSAKGLSSEGIATSIAGFSESIASKIDTLAPREIMIPKALVDNRAALTSHAISRHLDEFVSQTAMRMGPDTSRNINILLDHLRPAIAEIDREIGLFRIEVGVAPRALTIEAVNAECAEYWRHWQSVCGVRAEGLERRGK
jgi:hypothetical protein